ncbi:MAG TPA: hypothetical protein VD706_01495 [Candidatus Saccharimonadales bacterium]|nr:hypothetical protein [Candidatus Saccharimonadales bacterium]
MATPNAIRTMHEIAAADSVSEAAVLQAANMLGDEIVDLGRLRGEERSVSLGEFTLVMHGFHLADFSHNSVSGSTPQAEGAVKEGATELINRYTDLERRFNSTVDRYDERPVAAIDHLEERYGDTDNSQIIAIAVAPPTFGERPGSGEYALQYRLRRIRQPIDEAASTATQHGFEGTIELPVRHLQSFDDMLGLSEPINTNVVLARALRARGALTLHREDEFFDDNYFMGLPDIMDQRKFDSRNGNENAEHDLLFLRRALAAKELAVRAMLERTGRTSHVAFIASGENGRTSIAPVTV